MISESIYGKAIAEAKSELALLSLEYDKLAKRKAQLEAFIANAEPLVPATATTLGNETEPLFATATTPSAPIWRSIVNSINGKSESFSVRDALDALEQIGRPVDSPNKFQIVRAVLKKKTENFEQIAPGLFRVLKPIKHKEVTQ